MAKKVNQVGFKGILDVDINTGEGTITEIVKEVENVYNFFETLMEFNGKHITISIKEENELPTVDGE